MDGKIYELCDGIKLDDKQKEKNKLEIKLIEVLPITNMGYIFSGCYSSLESLPDISEWDTQNITNMSHMFYKCNSLKSLPDISKWNTKNVTDMSDMFYNCSSLESLPDISKWDTKNVYKFLIINIFT